MRGVVPFGGAGHSIVKSKAELDANPSDSEISDRAQSTEIFINSGHYKTITMVMDTLQIRLSPRLIEMIDSFVNKGIYSSRSDLIRDAVRRFVWANEAGSISSKGNSVAEIRKIRDRLSKGRIDLKKINSL